MLQTEERVRGEITVERRDCTRVHGPFPIKIKGVDQNGAEFDADETADNVSASGLFFKFNRKMQLGAELSFVIRLSTIPSEKSRAPLLAAVGTVRRIEPQADGSSGLGIAFTQHRFI